MKNKKETEKEKRKRKLEKGKNQKPRNQTKSGETKAMEKLAKNIVNQKNRQSMPRPDSRRLKEANFNIVY